MRRVRGQRRGVQVRGARRDGGPGLPVQGSRVPDQDVGQEFRLQRRDGRVVQQLLALAHVAVPLTDAVAADPTPRHATHLADGRRRGRRPRRGERTSR